MNSFPLIRINTARKDKMSTVCTKTTNKRPAFTLTEMLIAMAVTLLLMAALGKAFALMGETIREGRVQVNLTGQLRDITLRLNSDLSRCTVPIAPSSDERRGDGYFLYYEGPLSDSTGLLMGTSPTATNENSHQDSKIGDLDDYIAFTAVAEPGNWFRGKVPRFILDMKSVELLPANNDADTTNDVVYNANDFPGNPWDPIVITSKYAEIVYFASPEYTLGPDAADGRQQIFDYRADEFENPQFTDVIDNGLPDRIRLHRRVLLIRPDLNLRSGRLPARSFPHGTVMVDYMRPDPLNTAATGNVPAIKTPTLNGINQPQVQNAWLFGMAPVHQQCDLSVRRTIVVDSTAAPTAPGIGAPDDFVAANSLADLTKPENRFAHIRVPGAFISSSHNSSEPFTSMPLLAMGALPNILEPIVSGGAGFADAVPSTTGAVITPARLNGFLRPEFVLGMDHTHTDFIGDGWGVERLSEDVIATDVIGFDIKAFDSSSPSFISYGVDGMPGFATVDDDGNGSADDASEAGTPFSDDVVVGPNDASMRELLIYINNNSGSGAVRSDNGDFVDLFYPFLAGGTIRGPFELASHRHHTTNPTPADDIPSFRSAIFGLNSELSGLGTGTSTLHTDALYKSGRVISDTSGNIGIVQPAYDTFSDHYEKDGYLQTYPSRNGGNLLGVVWYLNNAAGLPQGSFRPDLGTNGLDDGLPGFNVFGADDPLEKETSAPFDTSIPAVKVTIRLENSTTRQVEQMSSVTHFDD